MVKWRIERGVAQQTESLVRGFYEVLLQVAQNAQRLRDIYANNKWWSVWNCNHLQMYWFFGLLGYKRNKVLNIIHFCLPGGGRATGVCVWCAGAGVGYSWYCRDRPCRLEEQHGIQRRYWWRRHFKHGLGWFKHFPVEQLIHREKKKVLYSQKVLHHLAMVVHLSPWHAFSLLLAWPIPLSLLSPSPFRLPWQPHCDPLVLGCSGEVQ